MSIAWARMYTDGTTTSFDLSTSENAKLAAALRQLVSEGSSVLRLAVDEARVQQYREQGRGLEVAYVVPDTLQYAGGTQVLTPSRLFIIWGGDLVDEAGESLVVLYGQPAYSAGPLKLMAGRSRLRELLASLPQSAAEQPDSH